MAVRPQDLVVPALERSALLARLDAGERARLLVRAEHLSFPPRTRIHGDADAGKHLYIVLEGTATLRRAQLPLRRLEPGDHFGELAELDGHHHGESVSSEGRLTVARLSAADWAALEREEPALATRLALGLAAALAAELDRLTGDMGLLIAGRSLPRAPEVTVRVLDAANDAGRRVQLLERRGAGRDHPVLLGVPETRSLKCLFLRVL